MPATVRPRRHTAPFSSAKPLLCRGVQTRYALPDGNAAEGASRGHKGQRRTMSRGASHAYTSLRDVHLTTAMLPLAVEPAAVFSDPGWARHSAERGNLCSGCLKAKPRQHPEKGIIGGSH